MTIETATRPLPFLKLAPLPSKVAATRMNDSAAKRTDQGLNSLAKEAF